MCEYSHAMGNGPGDLAHYWDYIYNNDSFFGGCVWEFTDHAAVIGDNVYQNPKYIYGGDSGEYPHFGCFCVDGLVYPDRRVHTGLLELKEIIKPFKAEYENGVLKIKNMRYFKDLSDLSLNLSVEKNGECIHKHSVCTRLYCLCDKFDFPHKGMHAFRRYYATRLINAGVEETIIISQMGHTDFNTTKQHYYKNNQEKEYISKTICKAIGG